MNNVSKNALLAVSVTLNVLFFAFFAFAASSSTSSFSFYEMGAGHVAAAAVAIVPDSGAVAFGPIEISMAVGEQAALQFSAISGRGQANRFVSPLFDRALVDVCETGHGLLVTALAEGEAILQTVSNDGIVDVARISIAK